MGGVVLCGDLAEGQPREEPRPLPCSRRGTRPQVPLPGPGTRGGGGGRCLQAVAAGGEGVSAPRAPLHVLGNSSPTFPATRSARPQLRDRLRPPLLPWAFQPQAGKFLAPAHPLVAAPSGHLGELQGPRHWLRVEGAVQPPRLGAPRPPRPAYDGASRSQLCGA